jgi:membrane protease subunit HflK
MTMNGSPPIPTAVPKNGPGSPLRQVARAARALLTGLVRPVLAVARLPSVHLSGNRRGDGPPDLDELWSDFNRKLGGLFGRGNKPPSQGGGQDPNFQPDMKSAGIGLGLIVGVVVLIWGCTGLFIVQEGEKGVVLSFGKITKTVEAGLQVRAPYPFQSHEIVPVTLRSVEVGRNSVAQNTGLRDSSMLTKDENIVDIRFNVQYRIKDVTRYLVENRSPDDAVGQAAESAVREIVGRSEMNAVLYEQRNDFQTQLIELIQAQLNQLDTGIMVVNVNVQSVQAPEQVQAAFDDAVKAGADSERLKNEGQAYANDVIPRAQGTANRLREEAIGYQGSVIARAEGDVQRFTSVLNEYQKAPTVTRDRLYIDAMQQIYSGVTKVMVDSRNNSNLLYLPLDKLLQQATPNAGAPAANSSSSSAAVPAPMEAVPAASNSVDLRSRENQRTRDRDGR